jgi:prephenate dehydrogenase
MHPAPRALIAGLGLIGGSIGLALRKRGWRVAFLDPNVSREDARRAEAADEKVESFGSADLTVLATPVDIAVEFIGTRDPGLGTATSVCGVMQPLRAAAGDRKFVAGHPLAGSHERGLRAARADLFQGKTWFVDREDTIVNRMINECGARVEIARADEHDAAIALTSHLPQILSTALAAYLEEHGIDERFAGSGLRTFLRLAGSDASVWTPLLNANRANIEAHADAVCGMVKSIVAGNPAAFDRARRLWTRLLSSAAE